MFHQMIKYTFFMVISFSLIFSGKVTAGEPMKAGDVLTQESFVFSIDEAEKLMKKLEKLEKQEELLEEYRELSEVRLEKIQLLEDRLILKDTMISERERLQEASDKRIKDLERYTRFRPLENAGFAVLGAGVVIGLIFAVDAIEDRVEATGPSLSGQQRRNFGINAQIYNIKF